MLFSFSKLPVSLLDLGFFGNKARQAASHCSGMSRAKIAPGAKIRRHHRCPWRNTRAGRRLFRATALVVATGTASWRSMRAGCRLFRPLLAGASGLPSGSRRLPAASRDAQFRLAAWLLCLLWGAGHAASPIDIYEFPNAELEARYRALASEFRCPKCLNVNLSGSDAPIAQDLRAAVWRLVVQEGRTDEEVRAFMQARYGDFVLYDPPVRPDTWLLWGGPALFALLGLGLIGYRLRNQRAAALSDADQARLRTILDED